MAEITGAIARRDDVGRQPHLFQGTRLEGIHVLARIGRLQVMPAHVQLGSRQQFAKGIALVEGGGALDAVGQCLRHGRAGLVVPGIVLQHLGMQRPMLVELGGKLHKVPRHRSARQRGITLVGEQPMQRMAEFVEHGGDFVRGQQRGLARRGHCKVGNIEGNGARAFQLCLVHQRIVPGTARLVVAAEEVKIHQPHMAAIGIAHFVHLHILVPGGKVGALVEGDAIQAVGGIKNTIIQHAVQLEIRLELAFIQIVLRLAQALGMEVPVPGLQRRSIAGLVDLRLQRCGLAPACRRRGRTQLLQESLHRGGVLRHLVIERVVGNGRIPQQRRLLRPQLRHFRNQRAGVVGILALGAAPLGFEQALARGAVGQLHQLRLLCRVLQRQNEFARQLAFFGGLGGAGDGFIGKPRQLRPVIHHQRGVLGGGQQLVLEAGFQRGEALVEFAQLYLVRL